MIEISYKIIGKVIMKNECIIKWDHFLKNNHKKKTDFKAGFK